MNRRVALVLFVNFIYLPYTLLVQLKALLRLISFFAFQFSIKILPNPSIHFDP